MGVMNLVVVMSLNGRGCGLVVLVKGEGWSGGGGSYCSENEM